MVLSPWTSATDPDLDISSRNILNAAAEMIQRYESVPSTVEGLLQAQDAVHHRLQANLHELQMLVAQQHVGYAELDDIARRLREFQGEDEIEAPDDFEDEEVDQIVDDFDS